MRLGITLPSRTGPLSAITEYARRADAAGFHSIWDYEVWHNPLMMLAAAGVATERAKLGTGLTGAFSRSPFEVANAAADVDEYSNGRLLFGVGTGVPEWLSAFHSTNARRPLGRISEFLEVLRRSWEYLGTGVGQAFEGEHYQFRPPPVNPWGFRELVRPTIPIYLGAMGPKMLQLCGEKADGWIGYFATPKFLDEHVRPNIAEGAARAGRDIADLDICAETICCVSPDRELAMARARRQVGFYVVHPVSDVAVALHGLQDPVNELRARMMSEGLAAFEHTDDRLVETFSITGTPEEARQKLAQYEGHIEHMALHTPYVPPFTAEESADAFANILDTFGDVASG